MIVEVFYFSKNMTKYRVNVAKCLLITDKAGYRDADASKNQEPMRP